MKMNRIKKVLAAALSFTMIFGMAITSNAATTNSTTQDTNVLELSSEGGTVSYNALTVEGGTVGNDTWPTVTRYNYYIEVASTGSKSSVPVIAIYDGDKYDLKIDGTIVNTDGEYEDTLNFSKGEKTFELVANDNSSSVFRSFTVFAGVKGADLGTVYVRVDMYNAVEWLKTNTNADTTKAVAAVKAAIEKSNKYTVNPDGQMSGFVEVNGLKSGATAMDALKAACKTLNLQTKGSDYYVSGIGDGTTFLSEKATTGYSGWLYLDKPVNGKAFEMANYGASSYKLSGGEQFVWCFANGWDSNQFSYLN